MKREPIQHNDSYIGQLLVKEGLITEADLARGLEEQKKNRGFLCANLVRLGFASEEKIFSILSLQIGVPFLQLKEIKPDPFLLSRIPARFALSCRCLPLRAVDDTVAVAMADPLNANAVKEIRHYLNTAKVKVFLAGDDDLCASIKKYYGLAC